MSSTSPGEWRTRSLWMQRTMYEPVGRLHGSEVADVVVVGAGFTGLWSAIQLKEADPAIDVAVCEAKVAAYGASGRNAGFAMTMVGRNLHDLVRKVGPERAKATHLAMRDTLGEIKKFSIAEGIDAAITAPGLLTVSNGPDQDLRIAQDLRAAERLGLDDFHSRSGAECQQMVASERLRCGHFEDDALLVDPAALCRGLRDAALRKGVRVYEHTPVDALVETGGGRVEARTPFGTVLADRALVATNAYAYSIKALRRFIFTVYAYIVVSEQLTDEQWARVGWDKRMGIEDKRVMPHFHRPTPDGRILWGGRDAPLSPIGPNPRRDRDSYVFSRLEETFRWNFPQLHDVAIEHGWGGPVCGSLNCFSSVGFLGPSERICYALGYAGHGVGQSYLAAKIVRDLLLGTKSELLELPLARKRPLPLPPEPIRSWVLAGSQGFLQRADDGAQTALARLALRVLQ